MTIPRQIVIFVRMFSRPFTNLRLAFLLLSVVVSSMGFLCSACNPSCSSVSLCSRFFILLQSSLVWGPRLLVSWPFLRTTYVYFFTFFCVCANRFSDSLAVLHHRELDYFSWEKIPRWETDDMQFKCFSYARRSSNSTTCACESPIEAACANPFPKKPPRWETLLGPWPMNRRVSHRSHARRG